MLLLKAGGQWKKYFISRRNLLTSGFFGGLFVSFIHSLIKGRNWNIKYLLKRASIFLITTYYNHTTDICAVLDVSFYKQLNILIQIQE